MEEVTVTIVGAGPSGLAVSACLAQNSISHIILEKEDCCASLWRKNAYDRLNLHLAKEFCSLPLMPHPPSSPTFLTKADFLQYIDRYVAYFNINPRYCRLVESAVYDEVGNKWRIEAKNTQEDIVEVYGAKFLVIATGENSEGYIPDVPGLDSFEGEIVHSKYYKSGTKYESKEVLVVGCGNSGMEIADDLHKWGASPSIVIRSPFHVLTKELTHQGMRMLKNLPVHVVDAVITFLANLEYGDLSKYGIYRPNKGPFYLKEVAGRSPVLDVGTIGKIKEGAIKVIPSHIMRTENKKVVFGNSMEKEFDAIVFATGYRSIANKWLKFHVLTKELTHQGMRKLKKLPVHVVDAVITFLANLEYGDLCKYGIYRPNKGPFYLKEVAGRSPVLDVGTIGKIKEGAIKVFPSHIMRTENKKVVFGNSMEKEFDAVVFATGYRSIANKWLKDYNYVLNDNGMPKNAFPNHWKGERDLYCAGLARRGLFGVKMDAEAIAEDINQTLR